MTGTALVRRVTGGSITDTPERIDLLEAWYAGKSAHTVAGYKADLERFAEWAGEPSATAALVRLMSAPHGAANATVMRYRGAMLEAKIASATINRRLGALRSVVKLARGLGYIDWQIETPGVESQPYRDTRGPGLDLARRMVQTLREDPSPKAVRDHALIRLMLDMGLRRAECVGLDLAHYDAEARTLSILGKKRSDREKLTVPEPTAAALNAWVAARGRKAGPLFVNLDRRTLKTLTDADETQPLPRLTGRSVARNVVAKAAQRAGITVAVRPHGLRHTAITHALDMGRDMRDVAKFSRHRSLQTLVVYDDNRQDKQGEVAGAVATAW